MKGFPENVTSRAQLSNILTTLLWAFAGRHAAVTYPLLEYGGFVPNAPHRIYMDSKGLPQFSNEMFGNKAVALVRLCIGSRGKDCGEVERVG